MNSVKKFETFIAEAVREGILIALEEGKGKSSDKGDNFDNVGKKHLKGETKKKEAKKEIHKAKRITKSQLAEGVRKALRMALKESGMPGGAMPAPGVAAGAPSSTTQEAKRGSMSGGVVPSAEELQAALDDIGGWDMDLQGANYLAFIYALQVAGLPEYIDLNNGENMHAVLNALSNAPPVEQLPETMDDEDIEDPRSMFNRNLNSWEVRYGRHGEKIEDHAQSLASGILDVLGWEWV